MLLFFVSCLFVCFFSSIQLNQGVKAICHNGFGGEGRQTEQRNTVEESKSSNNNLIITNDYMQIGVLTQGVKMKQCIMGSSQLSRPIAAQLRKDSGSLDLELSPCFIKKESLKFNLKSREGIQTGSWLYSRGG